MGDGQYDVDDDRDIANETSCNTMWTRMSPSAQNVWVSFTPRLSTRACCAISQKPWGQDQGAIIIQQLITWSMIVLLAHWLNAKRYMECPFFPDTRGVSYGPNITASLFTVNYVIHFECPQDFGPG